MSRTFANYVVSGAGREWANGTYTEQSADYFVFGQFSLYKEYDGTWRIFDEVSGIELYITTDTPATPDLGTWVKGQYGLEPPPTVVAGTPIPTKPDILVSGAGSDLVNGTYEHTAFEGGKPMYTKGSERYQIVNYGLWQILAPYTHPEWGDYNASYYQEKPSESGSPATPDLVAEWEIYTDEWNPTVGVNPPPTVTEYTPPPPPTYVLKVGGLSASARLSDIELTQTHTLDINSLTASAGLTEPTLTQTHDCRRLRIGREDRRLTIHAEDRTLVIPREDRTLKIKCCE